MNKLLIICSLYFTVNVFSQDPLQWNYSRKKINDSTYAVHFTAILDDAWHVYSQSQPETAVAMPTNIKIDANPLFKVKGKIKEVGEMIKWNDPATGISANEYSNKVDFVQTIIFKAKAKTSINGTITFQACTNEMCLQPKTINFSIAIP